MQLLDGKSLAASIKEEIKTEISVLIDAGERTPHLAAVLVGEDPASQTYVASKEKDCRETAITSFVYRVPDAIALQELLNVIDFLNQ